MPAKDYYSILGVSKTATQDEIKSAYRKLAKQYHPDLNPNDKVAAEKFKQCNEAYSIIGDPDKRKKFDNGELNFDGQGGFNPFEQGGFSASGFDDLFDMFSGFGFGSRSKGRSRQATGSDISHTLDLTFMESILGCKKSISFTRMEKCTVCSGLGAKDNSGIKVCDKCGGSGQVHFRQQTIFGIQTVVGECDKCRGNGKIITDPCKTCNGRGTLSKNKVMNVTIPAGVENGSILQIEREGNATQGTNSRNGNLQLVLRIRPSKIFRRERLNLFVEIPVPFSKAVNGGEIEVPGLNGVFIHKLAEGTKNDEMLCFKNRGIKTARGNSGDLFVTVKVEVPKAVNKSQKRTIDDFEREMTLKNYPERKQFLEEMQNLYK